MMRIVNQTSPVRWGQSVCILGIFLYPPAAGSLCQYVARSTYHTYHTHQSSQLTPPLPSHHTAQYPVSGQWNDSLVLSKGISGVDISPVVNGVMPRPSEPYRKTDSWIFWKDYYQVTGETNNRSDAILRYGKESEGILSDVFDNYSHLENGNSTKDILIKDTKDNPLKSWLYQNISHDTNKSILFGEIISFSVLSWCWVPVIYIEVGPKATVVCEGRHYSSKDWLFTFTVLGHSSLS